MATSSSELVTRCQVLFDVAGSAVLDNDEWTELLNDSYRKLWRTVVRINKSFRVNTDGPFTLTTTQTRALPSDYRETLAVRLNPGTDQVVILDRMTIRRASYGFERTFRLQNVSLYIEPLARCAGTYDHLYIPNVTPLVTPRSLTMDFGDDTSDGLGNLHFDSASSLFTVADIGKTIAFTNTVNSINSIDYTITNVTTANNITVTPAPPADPNFFGASTTATLLSNIDAELEQFAAFLVYDAANVALAREESDRLYELDFQREEQAVIAWASSQRSSEPDVVEDVRRRSYWGRGIP